MSKLRSKLSKFFRSDRARKISAAFLLVVVICSFFTISSSAAIDDTYELFGYRYFNDTVGSGLMQPNFFYFVTSGTPTYSVSFESSGQRFIGFGVKVNQTDVTSFQGVEVYSKDFGWYNISYRMINFGNSVTVTEDVYLFINQSTSTSSGSIYDEAYNSGYNKGFDVGRSEGYNSGYDAGLNVTGSENLGQNLLGDTLSAPMRALNSFTLYESSSGFEVTLGGVVGAAISLTLFIAFLKIFAGG